MKLIKQITSLYTAINGEKDLGFVPTMGSIHKGHESLVKISKKICKKTLVSIFINPKQFNNKKDYKTYPRNLGHDLAALRRLKVDFVYLPTVNQIYKKKMVSKITINKRQKVMCAKFRKGHFEGVLNVLDRLVNQISPKIMFMGEKDYQQYYLVKDFISKKYKTNVYLCKTIRDANGLALSSRNVLLDKTDIKTAGLIANKLIKLKRSLRRKNGPNNFTSKKFSQLIRQTKQILVKKLNIDVEYLEYRNLINLSTKIKNKHFKIFIAYYLDNIRLIDNF